MTIQWTIETSIAFVSLAGFAIQQALQIADPFIAWLAAKAAHGAPTSDGKKAFMGLASLIVAMAVVGIGHFNVFSFLYPNGVEAPLIGQILTGIVLSAGTEGANSIQK